MIIDFHTHVFDLTDPHDPAFASQEPVTWDALLGRLDEEGIDRAVVLPLGVSPEILQGPSLFSVGGDIAGQITPPERLKNRVILFGALDPRMGCRGNLTEQTVAETTAGRRRFDFSWLLQAFISRGCVGIGEVTANLAQDDPLVINLFGQCGDHGLPVLFHTTGPGDGVYGLYDEPGLPRLERLLAEVPGTTCIAHATGIWAELDGELTPADKYTYPKRPIRKAGRLPELLRKYPNLYVDTSGNSGFNGLTRDPEFGIRFLEEFQDKVIFGTDVCFAGAQNRMPHLDWLQKIRAEGRLSERAFGKITGANALKVLERLTEPAAR